MKAKQSNDDKRLAKDGYKRYSTLSPAQRAEVDADPVFRRYLDRIRREDWWFIKTTKGWATV